MGWPILGDSVYGTARRGSEKPASGLQLLARRVIVPIAKSGPPVVVEAPAPAHMLEALKVCGFSGEADLARPLLAEVDEAPPAAEIDQDSPRDRR